MKIIFTTYIKRKLCMHTAPFLFPHKYCATLSCSTPCYCPVFSLRHWMLLLHQGGGMYREFNFSLTKLGAGVGETGKPIILHPNGIVAEWAEKGACFLYSFPSRVPPCLTPGSFQQQLCTILLLPWFHNHVFKSKKWKWRSAP